MKPGSLLQIDWHLTQEANEIIQCLYQPNSYKLKQYGLLERPNLPMQLDEVGYKLFVYGRAGIGKTNFLMQLMGTESIAYSETPGIQVVVTYWPVKLFHTSRVVLFRLEFWDAGEAALKKFDHVLPACKEDMDAALAVFSFTDRASFEEMPQLVSRLLQPNEHPCPILIGTRYEQHMASEVTQRDIREFEQRYKIPVIKLKGSTTAATSDAQNRVVQKAEFNELATALNMICNELWKRDQALAGINISVH